MIRISQEGTEMRLIKTKKFTYAGEIKDGVMHGYGKITWHTGEQFEGNFFVGKRQGMGILKFVDGTEYVAEYYEDQINGHS
jgi:hypothetical protein